MRSGKAWFRWRGVVPFVGSILTLSGQGVGRADPPAAPPPPAPSQTLAQALALSEPLHDGVLITVGAETVKPSGGGAPTRSSDTAAQVAEAYGRSAQTFGMVTALAPPTVTVVYAPPETPNPYDGMPPGQVLKLLSATFSPEQWKAFLSPSGVGYVQMQEGPQRRLFEALFPGGHLLVIEDNPTGPNDPKTKQDISGTPLTQARLHLRYVTSLALQDTGKPNQHLFAGGFESKDAPKRYFMTNAQSDNVDHEYGAVVRETVANALKPGQLAFDRDALRVPVPLGGLKTVDDLVARIGTAAHVETYADARYGSRTLTVIDTAKSAPAGDLLQALALCVSGTFRQVGPAFVLTDDLVGVGTRHALWKSFEEKAQAMLPGGGDAFAEMSPTPRVPYTVQNISWGDDPLAFTPAQRKQFWTKWRADPGKSSSAMMDLTVPFEQLSPAQQEVAELDQKDNEKSHYDTTLDGTVMIQAEPMLEITLPALDGPVMVFQSYQGLLPYPSLTPAEEKSQAKRMEAEFSPFRSEDAPPPIGPLRPVIQGFTRRAVRIAPHTPREVSRAVAALKMLGFKEVWFQITLGPPAENAAALSLLTQTAKEAKAGGMTVFPDIRLLRWADAAPPALVDRDIEGRTASLAAKTARYGNPNVPDTLTPFAPDVWERLRALVRQAGATPGIGGMVWEDLTPAGYEGISSPGADNEPESAMGYAEAGRLACLRAIHADPVDLYPNGFMDERAHVSVPGFDDFQQEHALYNKWRALRGQTSVALVRRLAAELPPAFSGPMRLPLIVPPSDTSFSSVFGSWDDLSRPPPGVRYISQRGSDGEVLMGAPSIERMPSLLIYQRLELFEAPNASDWSWTNAARYTLRAAQRRGTRNILLDVTPKLGLLDLLADQERAFSSPKHSDSEK